MNEKISVDNNSNSTINMTAKTGTISQFKVVDCFLLSCYSMVVIIGVAGNLMVIKWFHNESRRNKPGSLLVIGLAVNDLIASIVTPLYQIHYIVADNKTPQYAWYLGKGLCKTLTPFTYIVLLTTPWLLVCIAAERLQ